MVKGDFKLSRLKIIEQCGLVKSGVEKSETEKFLLALGLKSSCSKNPGLKHGIGNFLANFVFKSLCISRDFELA